MPEQIQKTQTKNEKTNNALEKHICLKLTDLLAKEHLITPDEKLELTTRIKEGNYP